MLAVKNFGKKEAVVVASFVASFFYFLLAVLHITNVWVYLALSLCATFGAAFFNTIVWALVLDGIDYQEYTTGERDDATVYAIYSFSRKIGQALAGGLGGAALAWVGYVSSTAGETVVQSEKTIQNIYNLATLVPGITYAVIALIVLTVYPLTKRKLNDMIEVLNQRRAAK